MHAHHALIDDIHCAHGARLESIGLIDPRIDFGESIVLHADNCYRTGVIDNSRK